MLEGYFLEEAVKELRKIEENLKRTKSLLVEIIVALKTGFKMFECSNNITEQMLEIQKKIIEALAKHEH